MRAISLHAALLIAVVLIASSEARETMSSPRAGKIAQREEFNGERALINVNNLSMWFKNDGYSARDPDRITYFGPFRVRRFGLR